MEYMEQDRVAHQRQDYYLAQIAAEIRKGRVKNPRQIKLKDFLLDFTPAVPVRPPTTPEEKKAHIERSKAVWKAMAEQWKPTGRKPPIKRKPK